MTKTQSILIALAQEVTALSRTVGNLDEQDIATKLSNAHTQTIGDLVDHKADQHGIKNARDIGHAGCEMHDITLAMFDDVNAAIKDKAPKTIKKHDNALTNFDLGVGQYGEFAQ